jgi:transposase
LPDGDIADGLNQEVLISAVGKPFTASMIKWIRYRYQIPKARLVRPEELTVQQVAQRFGVSPNVVYYWIERGVIQARRLNAGSPYWITLNETEEQKLRDGVHNSCKIQRTSLTLVAVELRYFGGLTEEEIVTALKISPRTIRRDWDFAKAWLMHELRHTIRKPSRP